MTLEHYLKKWDLSAAIFVTGTQTSKIYKVEREGAESSLILKLLSEEGIRDEAPGAIALKTFGGSGAVELIESDQGAHLLEYADGRSLLDLVDGGEDERALSIIIDTIEKLHGRRSDTNPGGLVSLERRFRALFKNDLPSEPLFEKARQIARNLLATQKNAIVLHGDIHHENIIESSERGWLAIDPKGIYGEHTYDYVNTLMNPVSRESLVQDKKRLFAQIDSMVERASLDRERLIPFLFCHSCLSAAWSIDAGESPDHALKIAVLVEPELKGL